jgi:hypothetical protein
MAGLNGFFVADMHEVDGKMVDLPELRVFVKPSLYAEAGVGEKSGFAYVGPKLSAGGSFDVAVDINNSFTDDGKLRLGDTLARIIKDPIQALDVVDIDAKIGAFLKGTFLAQLNTDPPGGLSKFDPLLMVPLEIYNGTADFFGLTKFLKWDPNHTFDLPIFGLDSSDRSIEILGSELNLKDFLQNLATAIKQPLAV